MKKYCFIVAALLVMLSGCASSVTKDIQVQSDSDPKANLAGYKSYAWLGAAAILLDEKGRWEPPQFDADAEIKFLIDRELREHGLTQDSVNPDLIVAFAAGIDMDSMGIEVDPESGLEQLKNIPLGSLTVILVDAMTAKAVWIGVATADIQEDPTPETTKQRLDYAVSEMFHNLTHTH